MEKYYVLVMQDGEACFVTSIVGRDVEFLPDKKPLHMSKARAMDIANGLMLNGIPAYAVAANYEMPQPPLIKKEESAEKAVILRFRVHDEEDDTVTQNVWYTVYLSDEFDIEKLKDLISIVTERFYEDDDMTYFEVLEQYLLQSNVTFVNYADSRYYLLYDVI